jgi:hypothetical protein
LQRLGIIFVWLLQWYNVVAVGGLFVELVWLILLRAKKRVEGDDG